MSTTPTPPVHLIQVIRTELERRGAGTPDDPHRRVIQFWSPEGELLAETDPCARRHDLSYVEELEEKLDRAIRRGDARQEQAEELRRDLLETKAERDRAEAEVRRLWKIEHAQMHAGGRAWSTSTAVAPERASAEVDSALADAASQMTSLMERCDRAEDEVRRLQGEVTRLNVDRAFAINALRPLVEEWDRGAIEHFSDPSAPDEKARRRRVTEAWTALRNLIGMEPALQGPAKDPP